jgi:hypothetical protein
MNEQDLIKLKNRIERSKTETARISGRKEELMSRLMEKWECSSVDEGNKKLESMDQEIRDLDEKIDMGTERLENQAREKGIEL